MNSKITSFFFDLFFPSFCLGCEKEGAYLCFDCQSTLEILEHVYCLCKKDPLRRDPHHQSMTCDRCKHYPLSGLFVPLSYKERSLTRKLIHQYKYPPYLKDLTHTITHIISQYLRKLPSLWYPIIEQSILIPVPSDHYKKRYRGYNQAEELARALAEQFSIPLESQVLIKTRETPAQMTLSAEQRATNLLDAFVVKNSEKIQHQSILLIDDVYTTGATLSECAKTLKRAGAKKVYGLVIARDI